MGGALYIGDEVHAAAWRLTGIDVRIAAADTDMAQLFAAASADAELLLMSPASAARVPAAQLELARRALTPLLLVLPGRAASAGESELVQRVRAQLGMES